MAARRAAAVVCPSRVTARELTRWCQVDAEVFVAPHGVDTGGSEPGAQPWSRRCVVGGLDPRLSDGCPFLVFVGTLEPRKDVPTLVAAFARIADRHPDALLVLAGGPGWGASEVDRAVEMSGVRSRIVRTGYVADEVVPALLRAATAAVYPARYEGLASLLSRHWRAESAAGHHTGTAMEEVAGMLPCWLVPVIPTALTDALDAELAHAPGVASADAGRRQRGYDIVARHSWEASADRHVAAYLHATRRSVSPEGDGAPLSR